MSYNLKNALEHALKTKGMKKKELASKINMCPTVLSAKLNGRREFTINDIVEIMKVLKIETMSANKISITLID